MKSEFFGNNLVTSLEFQLKISCVYAEFNMHLASVTVQFRLQLEWLILHNRELNAHIPRSHSCHYSD